MKTNKSYAKRLRVTKNGKIISRAPGQNHFNAKNSGQQRIAKRRKLGMVMSMSKKEKAQFLHGLR
jgi:ribosomal protein L35